MLDNNFDVNVYLELSSLYKIPLSHSKKFHTGVPTDAFIQETCLPGKLVGNSYSNKFINGSQSVIWYKFNESSEVSHINLLWSCLTHRVTDNAY